MSPRSKDGRWAPVVCARPGCGEMFVPQRTDHVYHSQACANKDNPGVGGRKPSRGLGERTCAAPGCEVRFQPYRASQVTHSRQCYNKLPEVREMQRRSDGRPERQARKAELKRKNPKTGDHNRRNALARAGWTVEEYDQAHAEQWGCCAICGKAAKGGKTASSRLHADHDHKTGRRRALLCINCNVGIGMFDDDPDLLLAAINYIFLYRGQAAVTLGRSSSGGQSPRSAGN